MRRKPTRTASSCRWPAPRLPPGKRRGLNSCGYRARDAVRPTRGTLRSPLCSPALVYDLGHSQRDTEMSYDFLVDTYETERIKVVSVWSEFTGRGSSGAPAPGRSSRAQRARADGAPVCQRGSLVSRHAGHRRGRATFAAAGNPHGVHQALCRGQRKAPRCLAREARIRGGRKTRRSSMCAAHGRGS